MSAHPNVTEELERLIDATSLLDVMTGLELVCGECNANYKPLQQMMAAEYRRHTQRVQAMRAGRA